MIDSWRRVVVSHNSTIRCAWRVLDKEALRIVLVVDHNDKFLGTVTDGDIRRGLLASSSIEDPVMDVVNTDPVTVSAGLGAEELVELMEEKRLLALPVVEGGVLVGVEILQDIIEKPKFENPVFLMAGGFGTRLRPLTDSCPKPMLKIGNKPMLELAINGFKKSGFKNFYISTHYLPEQIENYFGDGSKFGVNIEYVNEEQPLGTGGALGLLPDGLDEELPIIVMNGDILTKINFERLLEFHNQNEADATICVREYEYQIPYGVISGESNRVASMEEKPTQRFAVNAGIYVISPHIVSSVTKNKKIDLPTLLETKMNNGCSLLMFPFHEYWLDIGRMDDFNRAQSDIYTLGLL